MKLHILCNDGSPLGVTLKDVHGEGGRVGVGGAELALLTMCEYWHDCGYDVTLYNNPEGQVDKFKQEHISYFNPDEDRDVLIIFRSPNPLAIMAKGKKIWWSCDQYTVGDFKAFSRTVDEIVCISEFHQEYFAETYKIYNTQVIDLAVRSWEYGDDVAPVEKDPYQCLFSSVPDRGLIPMAAAWRRIVEQVPEAKLVITSGWSLWTGSDMSHLEQKYRQAFAGLPNVRYLSAIKRKDLIIEQKKSTIFSYPCTYDELFCIAAAEAQVAGAWPITSGKGALRTTNMGTVLYGNPEHAEWQEDFASHVVYRLKNMKPINWVKRKAIERFHIDTIGEQWQKLFS